MKKLFTLVSVLILVLSSCSSEDNSTPILISKLITTYDDGSSLTIDYSYSSNKLLEETWSSGGIRKYFYENDLIIKIETKTDNVLTKELFYEYDSNNKVSIRKEYYYTASPFAFKTVFNYFSNNTAHYEVYRGDFIEQNELVYQGDYLFNSSGQLISSTSETPSGELINTNLISYDTNNSPFKNIVGFEKLYFNGFSPIGNKIESKEYASNNALMSSAIRQYQYNSDSYPSSCIMEFDTGEITTYEYFYNQ